MRGRTRTTIAVAALVGACITVIWVRTGTSHHSAANSPTRSTATSAEVAVTGLGCYPVSHLQLQPRIGVLARGPRSAPPTVTAELSGPRHPAPRVRKGIIDTFIAIVRRVEVDVPAAEGVQGGPISRTGLFSARNVIAKSAVAHVHDGDSRQLEVHLPTGLPARDYFVESNLHYVAGCGHSGYTGILGIVRITA